MVWEDVVELLVLLLRRVLCTSQKRPAAHEFCCEVPVPARCLSVSINNEVPYDTTDVFFQLNVNLCGVPARDLGGRKSTHRKASDKCRWSLAYRVREGLQTVV